MSLKLCDLYREILSSLNAVADENGLISIRNDDGELIPCMVDSERLALPTNELLRRGNWKAHGLQPFHPLSEHLTRGESPVLKKYRMLVQVRIAVAYQELLDTLVRLCANRSAHGTVSPKGAAVLQLLPNANDKTVKDFEKIIEEAASKGVGNLVKVYLRRGGIYDGRKVPRLCVVRFPLLDEFEGESTIVHGVKLSRKDFNGLKALLEYVTPNAQEVETYGACSNSSFAMYFDALTRAYVKTAERLNHLIHLYRKHMSNENHLKIDLSWVERFDDLEQYRNDIPPLSGNEGDLVDESAAGIQKANMVDSSSSTSNISRRLNESAGAPVPNSRSVEPAVEVQSSGFNSDAVSSALRMPTPAPVSTSAQTNTSDPNRGKTFAELQAERLKAMQGQAPQVMQPVMQPMVPPQMMMGYPAMPQQPGTYPNFQYGRMAPNPNMMYGQPMPPPQMMGYPPQQVIPMMPAYPPNYPPMYPNQQFYRSNEV